MASNQDAALDATRTLDDYTSDEAISPQDELDLSDEGFQVDRTNWQIVEATVDSDQPGRQSAVITFRTEQDDVEYEVTERWWLQYTGSGDAEKDALVTRIGRGQLKRLFNAALGTSEGSIAQLEGEWVSAEGDEDDRGFRTLNGIREPETADDETGEL